MNLNPEEIFKDLIDFRKEINASSIQIPFELKNNHFLLYLPEPPNPKYRKKRRFHSMACQIIREAQKDGTIKKFRRVPDDTKIFQIYGEEPQKLQECKCCKNEKKSVVDSERWNGIDIPPEINNGEYRPGCFLLYTPAAPNANFHFMKCKKVCEDIRNNWLGTYRFTNKTYFEVYRRTPQNEITINKTKLNVCEHCLSEWNNSSGWKNYNNDNFTKEQQDNIRKNFSIDEFFDYCLDYRAKNNKFPPDLEELYKLKDENKILIGAEINNDYPKNWNKNKIDNCMGISDAYRISRQYRCENCGVDLGEYETKYHGILVAHHINGCHFDVRPENIKVLCKLCHSKQPHHDKTVILSPEESTLFKKLYKEQNINIKTSIP